jgi:Tfp pilus assembly pilus retraction ATPase PilT
MRLKDLTFSDLFIGPSLDWSWYRVTPGSRVSVPIPNECAEEVDLLREHLRVLGSGKKDQRTTWPAHDGERLRVKRKVVDGGVTMFIVRRFTLVDLSLKSTGLQTSVIQVLMSDHPQLRSGVVGFFGPPGAGKSTTSAAFLLDRLREFGGAAWTIENPIELALQGRHGKGWCFQLEVDEDDEIGGEIRELYRAVPNILLIGEVRDARTAREVIRAAGSGYLVIITFHGNDLPSAISQFVRLATDGSGGATAASVADVLRVAIYLELHTLPIEGSVRKTSLVGDASTGVPPQALSAKPLFFLGKESAPRLAVRNGDYHQLDNEIDRQRRALMANNLTF